MITEEIKQLKEKLGAVILAHNYEPGEIQDVADFTGDSLGLSRKAAETDAEVIVFCGVRFMAETAKILSPDKTVLLPEKSAGCPMADMITAEQLKELKSRYPDALVVCYVNSSAEVKAESDYCCTSSNAVEIVDSLPADREIIFVPDVHLGRFVQKQTGRKLIFAQGYCPSHINITAEDIKKAKEENPEAVVLTHPECDEPVKDLSDKLLSTGGMLKFVKESSAGAFIIATEPGIIHPLKKARPDAEFIPAGENAICEDMKKITLEKLRDSLKNRQYRIEVPPEISKKAKVALDRMVEILPK